MGVCASDPRVPGGRLSGKTGPRSGAGRELVGTRVAGGGGHLDTHESVRGCPLGRCVPGAPARGGYVGERCVHVPCPARAPRGEQRVPSDVPGRSPGSRARSAGGYARRPGSCSAAPRAHLGAAPPARPEGRDRGVAGAWLCLPGGDRARAGCASFQGFLALPSVRACLENPEERERVPASARPASVPSAPGGARPARGCARAVSAGESWPTSGDLRRLGPAEDRGRLFELAGPSSPG